jgi:hypothetical protein
LQHNCTTPNPHSRVEKVCALDGVIAEHDTIKYEVGLLRYLVEKSAAMMDVKWEEGSGVCGGGAEEDDDARNICMVIPHE